MRIADPFGKEERVSGCHAAPVLPEAEREKQDLEWIREELFRRRLAFGLALLFTLAPFLTIYRDGHLV